MDNTFILKNNDLKRFIVSLDKAIKVCYATNDVVKESNVPKIVLGENKEHQESEKFKDYTRPFLSIQLDRRENASLTDTKFFSGMKQYGSLSPMSNAYSEQDIEYFRRDNEITLLLKAKGKNEIYNAIQTIEKIFMIKEIKSLLDCEMCVFVSAKEKREQDDSLYVSEIKLYVRTVIEKTTQDNAVLENVVVSYSSLCSYYDLNTQKCTFSQIHGTKAEGQDAANDFRCYNKSTCKDYEK